MSKSNFVEFPFLPITKDTFERQGWEKITEYDEKEEEDDVSSEYSYWILYLPKDNPNEEAPFLISSADDEYEELGIKKGEYYVEIADLYGLGFCSTEEQLEILYRALTGRNIE